MHDEEKVHVTTGAVDEFTTLKNQKRKRLKLEQIYDLDETG